MRIKVELHREVVWHIKHEFTAEERGGFYEQLERLRSDPVALIENSEAIHDPEADRYMLRFFRFRDWIAIFEMNRARDRILVRQCRRLVRKRQQELGTDDAS